MNAAAGEGGRPGGAFSPLPELMPAAALNRDLSWLVAASWEGAPVALADAPAVERIGFRAAGLWLVCPVEQVAEVAPPPPVYRVPNLPRWMPGAVSLRGEVMPVLDLSVWLGRPAEPVHPMLLVLGRGEERAALRIDDRPDIFHFTPSERVETSAAAETRGLPCRGVYRRGERSWIEVDGPELVEWLAGGRTESPETPKQATPTVALVESLSSEERT